MVGIHLGERMFALRGTHTGEAERFRGAATISALGWRTTSHAAFSEADVQALCSLHPIACLLKDNNGRWLCRPDARTAVTIS